MSMNHGYFPNIHMEVSVLGGTPSHHPFLDGIFHKINHFGPTIQSSLGVAPWPWKAQRFGGEMGEMGDGRLWEHYGETFWLIAVHHCVILCSPWHFPCECIWWVSRKHDFWIKLRSLPIFNTRLAIFSVNLAVFIHFPCTTWRSTYDFPIISGWDVAGFNPDLARNGRIVEDWPPQWASVTWQRWI